MDYFLIIALGILATLLTLASPYMGLLIFLGITYLRPQELYPALGPYHITRIMAIILLISFFIHQKSTSKTKQTIPPQTKIFLGLLALILLSAIPGWWKFSLGLFYEMVKIIIAYFLIYKLADSKSKLRGIIWTLLFLSSILASDTLYRYFGFAGTERIGGFSGAYFGNPGDFAVMMNFMIPIAFYLIWAEKKILSKLIALSCLLLLVGSIVATHARSAGVLTLATVLCTVILFGMWNYNQRIRIGSFTLCLLIVVFIVSIGSQSFWHRISSSLDRHQYTAITRIHLMVVGVKMFLKYPLLGVGARMYSSRYPEFSDWNLRGQIPHSMYVAIAAELGIGGIICLLLLLYYTLKDNWFIYRYMSIQNPESWYSPISLGLFVSIIAFMVGGMFQTVLYYHPPYYIIGLSVALKRLVEREETLVE